MILLDTDVLVDAALEDGEHGEVAKELLRTMRQGSEPAAIAWHSVSNLHYVVGRRRGAQYALAFISDLVRYVHVVPTGNDDVYYALDLPMSDFEDAMQVAAASAAGARLIVTRNLTDFRNSPIPASSPANALAAL